MGSYNRDYMQDDYESNSSRGSSWGQDVPTTKWIVIITVGVFFLQTLLTHSAVSNEPLKRLITGLEATSRGSIQLASATATEARPVAFPLDIPRISYVEEWLPLESDKVLRGQVWRLVTYMFCHHRYNPFGLAFNMLAVWFLGSMLERMYGSREFLWFYLVAGIASGLVFTTCGFLMELPVPYMGAGPCVMALLTLYATHFPYQEILFCFVIPVQIRVLLGIYAAIDVYWIAQASTGHAPWVTVVVITAELWGIVFGYTYRRMNWRISEFTRFIDFSKLRRSLRRSTASRSLKVFQPEPTSNIDEQVDAILAKIHDHGSESLTDRERAILQKASEQAKNRL